MSNRTLLEINHDYAGELGDGLLEALGHYLRSASRQNAKDLERYGIRVVGMRHHSEKYVIRDDAEGFPPLYLKETKR